MKKLIVPVLVLLAVAGFHIAPVSSHNNSAPNMECIGCHQGEMVADMVTIQGLPKSYVPGKLYAMTVVVNSKLKSSGDVAGGFAVETSAGELVVKDKKNTQMSDGILTHTQAGSALRKWTFGWKAPAQKMEAGISVMAVAANGDFSAAGDEVGSGSYTIAPKK
ncbi:MAG: hypothetical protein HZA17_13970 [Nitrospirae bacterium]|nr:hypothetical protein [Nitrospirota bacterium]